MILESNYAGVLHPVERGGRVCIPAEFRTKAGLTSQSKAEMLMTVRNELIIYAAENNARGFIGIKCSVAKNGQIAIPISYRRLLGIENGGKVEIFLTNQNEIIIKAAC